MEHDEKCNCKDCSDKFILDLMICENCGDYFAVEFANKKCTCPYCNSDEVKHCITKTVVIE
jgi:DNA-directed RNA polymerase subunit RPC12/RpoP